MFPTGGNRLRLAWLVTFLGLAPTTPALSTEAETGEVEEETIMRFSVRLDFGPDLGQNFGSLFEAPTADGRFVVGAGFLGLYNTYFRSDRYAVQFFIRPTDGERKFVTERLPRPSQDAGTYLFDLDGKLYAGGPGNDAGPRAWNEATRTWEAEGLKSGDFSYPLQGRMRLGNGLLLFNDNQVEYNGQPILTRPSQGNYHRFYYAQGHWFFYHTDWAGQSGYRPYEADEKGFTKLVACPWRPEDGGIDLSRANVLTLPFVGETPFAYGQLGSNVLTCSNIGGLYRFDGQAWQTLVLPVLEESYQIYSMLNFYDRLLMGHYPTGWLYEFDGANVARLEGWPPRLAGVSSSAREAQTTAIYGGDLFVGVWPWGELWRYNRDTDRWSWVERLFTHPAPTDETTHPYERECLAHELVMNQWGQRVTSLVPLGDSLMISTSAKWPCEWKPEYDFLGEDEWKEYGSVVRLTMPGNLSAPVRWTADETELEFLVSGEGMRIKQDGQTLASARVERDLLAEIGTAPQLGAVTWGEGVFGRFGGATLKGQVGTRPPPAE